MTDTETPSPFKDIEYVRALAETVVDRKGRDFVYNPDNLYVCQYLPLPEGNNPNGRDTGCLIGEMAKESGIIDMQNLRQGGAIDSPETIAIFGLSWPDDRSVIEYLSTLQTTQDTGSSWGEALDRANSMFPTTNNIEDDNA